MDRILSYLIRMIVWLSGFVKPLSRLGLMKYDEMSKGKTIKVLLVGYNGARNTGADARVVALTQQLEKAFSTDDVQLTVMTLDTESMKGYFSKSICLYRFTTLYFVSLLKAASRHHVAVLCEGSTLTRTFADALCMFFCEAAGIMKRQGKPCIAYGSEVGKLDGWLGKLSSDLCSHTYFMVRTEESLKNLKSLGLQGHVGTDTAWTLQTPDGESWARAELLRAGWDGHHPVVGVAVINPFCWPVRPSLIRWAKSMLTRDFSQQYDKMYYFSDSSDRRKKFKTYLSEVASAVNRYQQSTDAFVVIFGMEKLDTDVCHAFELQIKGAHTTYTSQNCNVFEMTGMLRQLTTLVTSRYHAAVLSMERAIPIVAISMDERLDGVIKETGLNDYLLHVDDMDLGNKVTELLEATDHHRKEIREAINMHLTEYKEKTNCMSQYFKTWLKEHIS